MKEDDQGERSVSVSERLLDDIKHHAFERMSDVQARKTNLYAERRLMRRGEIVPAGHREITVPRDSVMIFRDEAPLLNWGHPCRYLFFDAESAELLEEHEAEFPPDLVNESPTLEMFHEAVRMRPSALDYTVRLDARHRTFERYFYRGERYAILFSGASNNRHVNDMEFLWRTLVDVYGFEAGHIYVLNYDGTINYVGGPKPVTAWPGDSSAYRMPVHAEGTKSEFENVFDDLKGRLRRNDLLLIHTNNHGGHDGSGSYLCTPSGPDYYAPAFGAKLAELPKFAQLMVMMEQCHSGGFNASVIANSTADETTIASACGEYASSIGGANFDPFARDWIAAMTEATPSGGALAEDVDDNADGVISALEAFDYADDVKDPYDTPVYHETPASCGVDMHLGRRDPVLVLERIHDWLRLYRERIPGPIPPIERRRLPAMSIYDEVLADLEHIERLIHEEKVHV
jgi:hypothetical protein